VDGGKKKVVYCTQGGRSCARGPCSYPITWLANPHVQTERRASAESVNVVPEDEGRGEEGSVMQEDAGQNLERVAVDGALSGGHEHLLVREQHVGYGRLRVNGRTQQATVLQAEPQP